MEDKSEPNESNSLFSVKGEFSIELISDSEVESVEIDDPESVSFPPLKSSEISSSSSSSKNKLNAPFGFSVGITPKLSYKTSSSSIVATSELFAESSTEEMISFIVISPLYPLIQFSSISEIGYKVDFLSCVNLIIVSKYIGNVCK